MGGPDGAPQGAPVPRSRYANPFGPSTLIGVAVDGSLSEPGTITMTTSTTIPSVATFDGTSLSIIDRNGTPWVSAADLGRALGYARADIIGVLYGKHAGEFTPEMSLTIETMGRGQVAPTPTRIFSPRGCHLIAMFARTAKAAAFRRWVLDVLEGLAAPRPAKPAEPLVTPEFIDADHRLRAWAKATAIGSKSVPAVPAELLDGVVADMLFGQRWMVSFGSRLDMALTPIPEGRVMIDPKNLDHLTTVINEQAPLALLPDLIRIAADRLKRTRWPDKAGTP